MSVNSSNTTFHPFRFTCFRSKMSLHILSALSVIYILLLLPLFIFVLYLGYKKWRKHRFISTTLSHSDHFTYHSIFMQLIELSGLAFFFIGNYINLSKMWMVGINFMSLTSIGLALFHLLTCVEHYLAVVHPITYRGLRQAGGVRIRNMSIGCVWLLCFGSIIVLHLASYDIKMVLYYCVEGFFLFSVSFCSITVLCTLKRPGTGEVGGNREQVDRSKQRAFHTILAILGVLLIRFVGNLIISIMNTSGVLSTSDVCVVATSALWFGLPSSLVLPLLCLHRAGKLQCFKQNTESG